jgi:radical SAM superfamily enzyme YgiQ (UPF0313 family)
VFREPHGCAVDVCLAIPADATERLYRQLPLDALYAAAALRERPHPLTVALWDMRVADAPPVQRARVVAIATATSDRAQCYPLDLRPVGDAVASARSRLPAARVLLYGPHPTHLPEDTLRVTGADTVARGELESAACGGVLAALGAGGSPARVTSHLPIALADLPTPAYDLVDLADYHAEIVLEGGQVSSGRSAVLFTSRGCPYRCSFCHLPFGSAPRARTPAAVRGELAELSRAGAEHLFVLDYVFGLQPQHYAAVLDALASHGMRWIAQSRPEVVVKRDVRDWAAAGCGAVWLGAESDRVADARVGKPITRDLLGRAVGRLQDAGIVPLFFVMIGLPDERPGQVQRLLSWLDEFGVGFVANTLTLRPGTELFRTIAEELGGIPTTWEGVRALNAAYSAAVASDPQPALAELKRHPRYLGNLISAEHEAAAA